MIRWVHADTVKARHKIAEDSVVSLNSCRGLDIYHIRCEWFVAIQWRINTNTLWFEGISWQTKKAGLIFLTFEAAWLLGFSLTLLHRLDPPCWLALVKMVGSILLSLPRVGCIIRMSGLLLIDYRLRNFSCWCLKKWLDVLCSFVMRVEFCWSDILNAGINNLFRT